MPGSILDSFPLVAYFRDEFSQVSGGLSEDKKKKKHTNRETRKFCEAGIHEKNRSPPIPAFPI